MTLTREARRAEIEEAHRFRAQQLAQPRRSLAQLYDADLRRIDPHTRDLAAVIGIPHPLPDAEYADGVYTCRHETRCWNKHTCIRFAGEAAIPRPVWEALS